MVDRTLSCNGPKFVTLRIALLSAAGAFALAAQPAFAQAEEESEPPAATEEEGPLSNAPPSSAAREEGDIVVTGSRVARAGYDAPTPTTVIGVEQLVQGVPSTLIDAVSTLPAFRQTSTPATGGTGVSGTGGQSFVNLRGIGANRTLVLLDRRRFVPSTSAGTTDVAIFPSAIISRVEAVTGGASAAWGSDAVAGVVNFILDTRFTGLRGELVGGISSEGDNQNVRGSLSWGTPFADGRGHVVVSGEYYSTDGLSRADRDFSIYNTSAVTNPAYTATNGQFQRLVLPYVYFATATYGGLVLNGPLAGLMFLPGGAFTQRPAPLLTSGTNAVYSGVQNLPFLGNTTVLTVPQERYNFFARGSYEVADGITVFAEGSWAQSNTGPLTGSAPSTVAAGNLTIQRDNAFLPAAFTARMDDPNGDGNQADRITSFLLGMFRADWGAGLVSQENRTWRGVLGLDADLGAGWTLNAYYQHGENRGFREVGGNALWNRVREASDAVRRPDGTIVCRSTLTNPANGCVPLNVFGEGASTPEMLAYVIGTSTALLNTSQDVVAVSASGEPFSLWAGPVSVAFGAEYRHESAVQVVDPLSATLQFALANPQPIDGRVNVKEAFAEVVVPIIANVGPIFDKVEISAAARLTDYSTSGSVVTWKVGATWALNNDVRLRFTRSRDIRAPNILELFSGTLQSSTTITDPFEIDDDNNPATPRRANVQYIFQGTTSGNRNLDVETANTIAAGIVVQPDWFPGFSVSVDYYQIKIDNSIATLSHQEILERCFAGATDLCTLITRDAGNNRVVAFVSPYLNFQSLETWGYDIETSYRFTPSFGGTGQIRLMANYVGKLATDDGRNVIDRAGDLGSGQPHWNLDFTATYQRGPWDFYVNATRIGGGRFNNTFVRPVDISDNTIEAVTYVDATIQHRFNIGPQRHVTVFFNVSNILNEEPPALFASSGGANYDRIGRRFRGGVRFRL